MALIKYSALVSDMRNKLNGSVASKNRAGNYLRNKTTPVNPQTTWQQSVRALFGSISASWRSLTEAQRRAWDTASDQYPYTNIFGDTKYLSGFGLYVKLNQNLGKVGQSQIENPPVPPDFPLIFPSNLVAVENGVVSFDISPTTLPLGTNLIVYATPNVLPGKQYVKNQFRMLGVIAPVAGVVTITDQWTERFGQPVEGRKVFVRMALLDTASGFQGVPYEVQAVVSGA